MSEPYTPTTEAIRNFASAGMLALGGELSRSGPAERDRAFDRWLAAHDAEQRAEALDGAAREMPELREMPTRWGPVDGVRAWLNDRAQTVRDERSTT